MADWTLESNIMGCPCCLAKTQGVSLCTQVRAAAGRPARLPSLPPYLRRSLHALPACHGAPDGFWGVALAHRACPCAGRELLCLLGLWGGRNGCWHLSGAASPSRRCRRLQMDHECLWNVTSRKSYCDCSVTGTEGGREAARPVWGSAAGHWAHLLPVPAPYMGSGAAGSQEGHPAVCSAQAAPAQAAPLPCLLPALAACTQQAVHTAACAQHAVLCLALAAPPLQATRRTGTTPMRPAASCMRSAGRTSCRRLSSLWMCRWPACAPLRVGMQLRMRRCPLLRTHVQNSPAPCARLQRPARPLASFPPDQGKGMAGVQVHAIHGGQPCQQCCIPRPCL